MGKKPAENPLKASKTNCAQAPSHKTQSSIHLYTKMETTATKTHRSCTEPSRHPSATAPALTDTWNQQLFQTGWIKAVNIRMLNGPIVLTRKQPNNDGAGCQTSQPAHTRQLRANYVAQGPFDFVQ